MQPQTLYWIIFMVGWFVLMFILVPPEQVSRFARFGFWMGLVQAVIILWLAQDYFKLFQSVGDPKLLGIPLLTALSWMPPVIIFAYFFPLTKPMVLKAGYIMIFAVGSAFSQYLLELFGLWESLRWNPFYTFILAIITHSIMTGYLYLTYRPLKD